MVDDQDPEGAMEKNKEASFGCLQTKNPPHCSQGSGDGIEGSHDWKDEANAHPVGLESNNPFHRSTYPNQGYTRPFCHQEFLDWPNIYPDIQRVRQNQMNIYENYIYPANRDSFFPVENRTHYLPLKMFYQGHQHQLHFQEFHYFVVIDFEATCDKERKPHPQEIIEFPSVLVNSVTGQLEASFQTYVRPVYHQLLTDYCKELTGIQQIQVDRGVSLSDALLMHDKWLEDKGIKHKSFAVVTWGNWDCRTMLESECKFKRIRKPPYFNRWINLKGSFQDIFGVRCNLKEAVERSGLTWEGRPHCGLDDARNTARLLALLVHWGFRFSITNELPPIDQPLTHRPFNSHPIDPMQHLQNLKESPGPISQFHPFMDSTGNERFTYCFCGVMSNKCVIRKPGPMQGRCFFGCGNWTASRRAVCNYFVWASP